MHISVLTNILGRCLLTVFPWDYLFTVLCSSPGCLLEAGKEVVFNPEDDGFEHQLDLRMVSSLIHRLSFYNPAIFSLFPLSRFHGRTSYRLLYCTFTKRISDVLQITTEQNLTYTSTINYQTRHYYHTHKHGWVLK